MAGLRAASVFMARFESREEALASPSFVVATKERQRARDGGSGLGTDGLDKLGNTMSFKGDALVLVTCSFPRVELRLLACQDARRVWHQYSQVEPYLLLPSALVAVWLLLKFRRYFHFFRRH